jgi:hypothetical protein
MLNIKHRGSPPDGAQWSMGGKHMVRISEGDARKLSPTFLPRMGYETDVRVVRMAEHPNFYRRLTLMNMSGHYYVACTTRIFADWPELFGVTITPNLEELT